MHKQNQISFGRSTLYFLLIAFIFLALSSCNTIDPPGDNRIVLTVADVSSTEAWLKISSSGLNSSSVINIKKDELLVAQIRNLSKDTLIYIDSLFPGTAYTFQAVVQPENTASSKTSVRTLDTTSHDFTWETYPIGDYASRINDITIIDENNIYAAGEIYMNDSAGNYDYTPYCFAKWDGSKWQPGKLKFFPPGAIGDSANAIGSAIFAVNENDIWMSAGAVFRWNGSRWNIQYNRDADGALKIWGEGKSDCWFVGYGGAITHYFEGSWNKIESATTSNIYDIVGYTNPDNSERELLCASTDNNFFDSKLLKITNGNNVKNISFPINRFITSVWTSNGLTQYAGGDGAFANRTGEWKEIKSIIYETAKIRGNGLNDIFIGGSRGLVAHFNGSSWKIINNEQYGVSYTSVCIKGDIAAFAGWNYGKAIITIGKRR